MYASTQHHPVTYASLCRTCGRIGGLLVIAFWATMVAWDLTMEGPPAAEAYAHAAILAVIFTGYVVGWWKELLGATLAIGGTVVLFIVCEKLQTAMPPEGLWLAAPGVFYALAHFLDRKHDVERQETFS